MKACVLESVGNIIYKDVPDPILKDGEVLIKVKACGICSSDIPRIFITGTYTFPTIPGHEFSGEIVDVGSNIDRALIGKRAVVFPLLPCRQCHSCKVEEYSRCENYDYFGSRCNGAFAEYISVPIWNIVTFSDKIPYSLAALCEPAAVAKHCVDFGKVKNGDTVAVIGTGTIGMIATVWAKIFGASKVILIGRNNKKFTFAKKLGIDYFIDSSKENADVDFMKITNNLGADVVLECVGSNQAINKAISSAKKGGRIVLTGNPESNITFEKQVYWKILRGELTVKGTWNSSFNNRINDWETTIEYLEKDKLPIGDLITHTFSLSEYRKAFDLMRLRNELSIKVMFTM